jgi:transposase
MSFEERAAAMTKEEVAALLASHHALRGVHDDLSTKYQLEVTKRQELERRVAWFERQLFGQKSERRIYEKTGAQLCLGELLPVDQKPPEPKETVKSYERRQRREFPDLADDESGLRFDSSVPVETINVPNPVIESLSADQIEEITEKVTYRLAQMRGAYKVLKYVRKVVKIKETGNLTSPPAPAAVIDRSYADVSFIVGLILDKILYYLPLYRQHQRLEACGIHLSRATLINLVLRAAQLLEPIYLALLSSILQSQVLVMDETPVRAGRKSKGKMQKGYFWPIYGERDEIAFLFAASRGLKVVSEALKDFGGILVTDGYRVYERFAEKVNSVTHAQCWVHTRRGFDEAKKEEPVLSNQALDFISALYRIEERGKHLGDEERLELRGKESKPIVDEFFRWLTTTFATKVLLPTNAFTRAVNYALEREKALRVFLEYPNVPMDTNGVERALRPIPMGRKNWLFCWSELGARAVGILQSLVSSCKLQGVDPYVYLVDVLQRIDSHPAQDVHLLTPRLWKENFAKSPLISDLERLAQNAAR